MPRRIRSSIVSSLLRCSTRVHPRLSSTSMAHEESFDLHPASQRQGISWIRRIQLTKVTRGDALPPVSIPASPARTLIDMSWPHQHPLTPNHRQLEQVPAASVLSSVPIMSPEVARPQPSRGSLVTDSEAPCTRKDEGDTYMTRQGLWLRPSRHSFLGSLDVPL
jgi:hypothetical protein